MAKVDLKSAYRSVEIKPEQYTLTGLRWKFNGEDRATNIIDRCLGFGARKAPSIFSRITQSVARMMHRRSFNCIVYLDDFFLCENSFSRCLMALSTLVHLLRSLNFKINWQKITDPCRRMNFLGVEIDLDKEQLRLDPDKTTALCDHLQETTVKRRITKVQLQALAGRLLWASRVHAWGRWHLSPFFHLISMLREARHKALINANLRTELNWWLTILSTGSNCLRIWDSARSITDIATDSSLCGAGAFLRGECMYINWLLDKPELSTAHINVKELAVIQLALKKYAPSLSGHHLIIYTDNAAACYMLNKGYSRNRCHCSNTWLYHHRTPYIPDAISRLHQRGQWQRLCSLLKCYNPQLLPACTMPTISYVYLLQLWMRGFDCVFSYLKPAVDKKMSTR